MNAKNRDPAVATTHLIAEYSGCQPGILDDESAVESMLVEAAQASGAIVVARVFHRFLPQGVTGFVMADKSHLSVHTWPEDKYAAVDILTGAAGDPHRAHAVLTEALGAQASELVLVSRGLAGTNTMCVQGHRRVGSHRVDFRSPQLPGGVRLGRSTERGLGLIATRDFCCGDAIYEVTATLSPWETEFIVETDLGECVRVAESLGYSLHTPLIELWPEQVRRSIVQRYDLADPSPIGILDHITEYGARGTLMMGFDGLASHSRDPNMALDWTASGIAFDADDQPVWSVQQRACRDIAAAGVLLVDYRVSMFDFVPPGDWCP